MPCMKAYLSIVFLLSIKVFEVLIYSFLLYHQSGFQCFILLKPPANSCSNSHACVSQELAAIKARVQELEMEEETDRLKEEEERCDAVDMQLLTSSSLPGETARASTYPPCGLLLCHIGVQLNTD